MLIYTSYYGHNGSWTNGDTKFCLIRHTHKTFRQLIITHFKHLDNFKIKMTSTSATSEFYSTGTNKLVPWQKWFDLINTILLKLRLVHFICKVERNNFLDNPINYFQLLSTCRHVFRRCRRTWTPIFGNCVSHLVTSPVEVVSIILKGYWEIANFPLRSAHVDLHGILKWTVYIAAEPSLRYGWRRTHFRNWWRRRGLGSELFAF